MFHINTDMYAVYICPVFSSGNIKNLNLLRETQLGYENVHILVSRNKLQSLNSLQICKINIRMLRKIVVAFDDSLGHKQ